MRRIYWRKRLNDFSRFWLNPSTTQNNSENSPLLLTERLEDRIVLAAPVAMDDAVMTTDEETPVSGNVFDDNGNGADTDPDGDMFEVTEVNGSGANVGNEISLTSGALLTVNSNGTFTYDPNGQFEHLADGATDIDSFEYTITDSNGDTATEAATVLVTITGTNDPPVVDTVIPDQMNNDSENVNLDVSGNFDDPDTNDTLTFTATGLPPGLSIDSDGLITGTIDSDASQSSPYAVVVTAEDGSGEMTTDEFDWTIDNPVPVAQNDSFSTDEDTPVSGNVFSDNGNGADSDPDGDMIEVSEINGSTINVGNEISLTSGALLTLNDDGTFTYDPNGQFESLAVGEMATDSFTYQISDGNGGFDSATVTITITGTNDAPVITNGPDTADLDETDTTLTANGTLTISDVDTTDTVTADHTLVVTGTSDRMDPAAPTDAELLAMLTLDPTAILDATENSDILGWEFDSGTEFFDYLAVGETLILTYTVTVTDSQMATATETITITITGTNDAPVITNGPDTADLDETDTTLTANGTLTISDVDTTDTVTADHTLVVTGTSDRMDPAAPTDAELLAMLTLDPTAILDATENSDILGWEFDSGTEFFDYLAVGETLILTYTVTVTDSQMATATETITITITGTNDAPVITNGPDTADLDETDTTLTANGTLTISDVDTTDTVTADHTLVVTGTSDRMDPAAPTDAELLAMLTLDPTAILDATENSDILGWEFDSGTEFFDYLAVGETLILTYTVTVTDSQMATATETITITITGTNDAPVITNGPDTADLDETDTTLTANGTLTISDVDTTDTVTADHTLVVTGTSDRMDPAAPTDAELLAMLTLDPTAILDATENSDILGWEFDSGTEFFDYLAVGETLILTYTVTVTDSQMATATETITITITGTNDAPVITNGPDTADLDETDTTLTANGTLTISDVDTTDTVTADHTLVVTGTSDRMDPAAPTDAELLAMLTLDPTAILDATENSDILGWEFDSGTEFFDYLAVGETLILTYTVTVTDSQMATATETITITITGTNDAPVITNGPDTADLDETDTTLTANGTLTISDVDTTDTVTADHTLVVTGTSDRMDPAAPTDAELLAMLTLDPTAILDATENSDILGWEFDSGTEFFDYLAVGETLILTYTVTVTDSQMATATETITITITGTNDAPVITNGPDTADLDETDTTLTANGTLTISDVDTTDTVTADHTLVVTGTSDRMDPAAPTDAELLAMLTLDPTAILDATENSDILGWEFDSGTEFFDYLAVGETLILTYTVTVTDSQMATATETITITITGTNDAPVITNGPDTADLDETDTTLTANGTLTISDVDTTDTVTADHTLVVTGTSDRMDPAAPTDAELLAMLTLDPTAILDATENSDILGWEFDSGTEFFDYLAVGETLILTYTVTVTDSQMATATETITITITGTNDAPVITNGPDTADLDETDTTLTANGTLTISDVDTTDTVTADHTLVVTGTSDRMDPAAPTDAELLAMLTLDPTAILDATENSDILGWEFDSGTEFFDYLAVGETLILTYTVTVTDSQMATATETITITITGTNDAPVITNGPDTADLDETDTTLTANGTLTISDVDTTDTVTADHTLVVTGTSDRMDPAAPTDAELLAMLTLDPTAILDATENSDILGWEFDSGTEFFDYLAVGETLILTYTVTVTDSQMATATETITITITGTNDAPVITNGPDTADLDETDTTLTANGTLTISDVDTTDTVTADHTLVVTGTSDRMDPAAPTDAELLAMLTLDPTAILDATENSDILGWEFDSGTEFFDYLAVGETLILTYTVTVTDSQMATATETITITITGTNDAPVITNGPDTADLDETDTTLTANGTLTISDVDTTDTVTADHTLVVTGTSDRMDPAAPTDAELLAMLTLDPTAILDATENSDILGWEFDSGTEFFDYLAVGETLILTYTVTVTDSQMATATETITITITGTNDAPVITNGPDTADLDETDTTLTANGTLTISDVDTTDTVTADHTLVVTGTSDRMDPAAPTDAELLAMLTLDPTAILDATENSDILGWEFDSGTEFFDYLAVGETLILTYTVTVTDSQMATATETITITITGTNDAPVITNGPDTADLDETDTTLTANGTLTISDVDTTDTVTADHTLVVTGTSDRMDPAAPTDAELLAMLTLDPTAILDATENSDILGWEFDSGTEFFDYLAVGETLILTYTVTVTDSQMATATETITITITGTNDAPVITNGPDTADLDETDTTLTANGTLTISDVDTTDTVTADHTLVVTGTSDRMDPAAPTDAELLAMLTLDPTAILDATENSDILGWEFDSGTEFFDYLAVGETLILTYTVTVTDSQMATATETITITITGTNDAPVITNGPDTADLDETDTTLTANGTLTISDVDTTDTVTADHTLVVTGTSNRMDSAAPTDAELLAMLTLDPSAILDATENSATLGWDFDSGSEAFDYLADGETLILTYTITVTDSQGAMATETVTITITGANDTPVLVLTDLNIIRNATARDLHNTLSDGPDIPDFSGIDLTQPIDLSALPSLSIVEGENIELSFTIYDPDNGDSVGAELFLVTRDAYNEAMMNNEKLNADDPRVVFLDSEQTLTKTDKLFGEDFSAKIIDDFPPGTSVDELVFVLQFEDILEARVEEAITEYEFTSMDPAYQLFNYTPLIFNPSSTSPVVLPTELQGLPNITSIDFELVGGEFVTTVEGFVLETGSPQTDPLTGKLIDDETNEILVEGLTIVPGSPIDLLTTTVDSDGKIPTGNATIGRFYSVTITVPVSSNLISLSGKTLRATFSVEDNDDGESSISDILVNFPALVITQPVIIDSEVVADPVLEEVRTAVAQALTVVKRIVTPQIPLSNKIEADTYEVLVRIVIDDGGNGENDEPLYQYIDLFESDDDQAEASEQTIDYARNRLEQFLDRISQLPDNRYQIILRQNRGDLNVSETIILDVIVQDGQIIEVQDQEEFENNPENMSETNRPKIDAGGSSEDVPQNEQTEQISAAGAMSLSSLAVLEFANRKKRPLPDQSRTLKNQTARWTDRKKSSLWATLYRNGFKQ
jgi:VCBS repeat-containing protein